MTSPTIGSWTREELAEDLIIRVPDRKPGRYNVGSTVLALVILAGIFGASSYTFSMVSKAPDATAAGTADWLVSPQKEEENTYLQAESVYHAFVEATYEQVDPELETMIREQFFADTPADTMDFQEVTTQIRQVLRMQTCLNTAPASLPKGEDYLTWFLTEEQEGNAVAYAAAAVLVYRVAGDPARYVEGYHLAEQEKNDAVLTSQNAHAWAEVYVSGEGWLPMEVVPGMYTETYTNQMVEGKPAYQVGTSRQDDGLQAAGGTGRRQRSAGLTGKYRTGDSVWRILFVSASGIAACDSCADTTETERNGKRRNCGILCKCIP